MFNRSLIFLFGLQFYRCFLILFHCEHQLMENGPSSMPSKTTAVQLHRRVGHSSPAAVRHAGAAPTQLTGASAVDMEGTSAAASDKIDAAEPGSSSWDLTRPTCVTVAPPPGNTCLWSQVTPGVPQVTPGGAEVTPGGAEVTQVIWGVTPVTRDDPGDRGDPSVTQVTQGASVQWWYHLKTWTFGWLEVQRTNCVAVFQSDSKILALTHQTQHDVRRKEDKVDLYNKKYRVTWTNHMEAPVWTKGSFIKNKMNTIRN